MRSYLFIGNKKCRIYAACGVSQTPNKSYKYEEVFMEKNENEELNKKLTWIRKTKTEADAEIKKLTNQVNLLKKELLK